METRSLRIRNKTRELLVLNLPASVVPEASQVMRVGSRSHALRTGQGLRPAGTTVADKRVGGSLTLLPKGSRAGDVVEGLPVSVRKAPEVQAAERAQKIEIEVVVKRHTGEQPGGAERPAPARPPSAAPAPPPSKKEKPQ